MQGAPQKTKLHDCYTDVEGLGQYQASFLAVHLEIVSSYKVRSASLQVSPSGS